MGVNYADLRALNKVLKKLVMSVQPTFITQAGTPQLPSATASVATNSAAQQEMESAEGKRRQSGVPSPY